MKIMKKTYLQPAIEVINISSQQMLCGSITEVGDNLNIVISPEEPSGVFEDDVINSREFDTWSEEEYLSE